MRMLMHRKCRKQTKKVLRAARKRCLRYRRVRGMKSAYKNCVHRESAKLRGCGP